MNDVGLIVAFPVLAFVFIIGFHVYTSAKSNFARLHGFFAMALAVAGLVVWMFFAVHDIATTLNTN